MAPIAGKVKNIFRRFSFTPKKASPPAVVVLPLVKNTKGKNLRNGPAAYARAARRYNLESPVFAGRRGVVYKRKEVLHEAHKRHHHHHYRPDFPVSDDPNSPIYSPPGKRSSGGAGEGESEVPAQDVQNDLEYVVSVQIGTPAVSLLLDFDTGSSDLWVWSSEYRGSTSGHTVYNPTSSSSAKQVSGSTWNISYGDGSSASGNVYTDAVAVGTVTIPNQAVELAEKMSSSFTQDGSDGLLGLAWPSINTVSPTPVATPVENMISQKLISQGLFSVALDQGDNNGFYTFGGLDSGRAGVSDSDITYTPVDNSQGFWMFDSTSATLNGKTITRSGNTAIADTGTTLCLVDDDTTKQIYALIPGSKIDNEQGGYVYPSDAEVPTVQFAVGDKLITVNPADFAFSDAGNGLTFGGIQSRGNNPFDILGDVFLKSVYVVFDQANTQIGVAQRSGNAAAAATSD